MCLLKESADEPGPWPHKGPQASANRAALRIEEPSVEGLAAAAVDRLGIVVVVEEAAAEAGHQFVPVVRIDPA